MNCKYAYLDVVSETGDPVTQGNIPASVTAEQLFHAKMLSAVTAQLSVAHASGITDAGKGLTFKLFWDSEKDC